MEKLTLQQNPLNEEPSADIKYLNRIMELKKGGTEIKRKIKEAKNDTKTILEMDLEDVKKQIHQYKNSLRTFKKNKETRDLEKVAGKDNVIEIRNFKKDKHNNEFNDIDNNEIGEKFLNSLKKFKNRKHA